MAGHPPLRDNSGHYNSYGYGPGPTYAVVPLPTTEQWSNVQLSTTTRDIYDISGTSLVASNFSYEGYAARLPSINDIPEHCRNQYTKGSGCEYDRQGDQESTA